MSHHKACECDHCEYEPGNDVIWMFLSGFFVLGGLGTWAYREVLALLG